MAATTKGLRGIHVLFWLLGLFSVMIAVNTVFVFWALKSFPGEQVKNSYVLGLDYNREVERRREQEKLGWTSEVGLVRVGGGHLVVRMLHADQSPITGLSVSASVHVAGEARSETVALTEASPGEYIAAVAVPANVRMELHVSARRAHEAKTIFTASKTLVMP